MAKRFICIVVMLVACFAGVPAYCETGDLRPVTNIAAKVQTLTLDQAVAMAKTGNRTLRNAVLEVQKTEDTLKAAKTQYYPEIQLSASVTRTLTDMKFKVSDDSLYGIQTSSYGQSGTTTLTIPAETDAYAGVSITQPLSQIYRIAMEVEVERKTHEIASEKERHARHELVNGVKKLYYELIQSESSLLAVNEAIAFYRELSRVLDDQLKQQTVLRHEALDIKAQLAKYEYDEMSMKNAVRTMKEQMNELLARDIETPFDIMPVPEVVLKEEDFADARVRALKGRPDIKVSELTAMQAEFSKNAKASEFIPDLSLGFNYHTMSSLPVGFTYVSLTLTWKQPDWGKTWHELAARKRALQQAENEIEAARAKASVDINKTIRKLTETKKLLDARRLGREAAQEKLSASMNLYKAGSILLKDLLKDQAALAEANRHCHEAQGTYFSARADLDKALGEE
ncbi:MAG: TolC family protein [Nitrospirae bacterium]|nr:TolC family protein [Nitrospirota bacterium]